MKDRMLSCETDLVGFLKVEREKMLAKILADNFLK